MTIERTSTFCWPHLLSISTGIARGRKVALLVIPGTTGISARRGRTKQRPAADEEFWPANRTLKLVATMQVGCGPSTLKSRSSPSHRPRLVLVRDPGGGGGREGVWQVAGWSLVWSLSGTSARLLTPASNVGETTANMRATQAGGRKNLGLGMLEPLFLVKAAITPATLVCASAVHILLGFRNDRRCKLDDWHCTRKMKCHGVAASFSHMVPAGFARGGLRLWLLIAHGSSCVGWLPRRACGVAL